MSDNLDLSATAAARDQLFEQMQWGHGNDDYSAVLRKYLHEPGPEFSEKQQSEESLQQLNAGDSITASAEAETLTVEPQETAVLVAQQPVLNFSGTTGAAAPDATP